MIFKKIILILLVLLISCELPTENISYEKQPVLFGYIDAGLNRIEPISLSWTNTFSASHLEQENYIENANVSISTNGNIPEYENIEFNYIGSGEYIAISPDNLEITPGSEWSIIITFNYDDKNYILNSTTTIPDEINLTSTESDIPWNCNGAPVFVNSDFNLYQDQNVPSLIEDWIEGGLDAENIPFLGSIQSDEIIYNTEECYTSSFASVPFFTLNIGSENENIVSRYTTIALETDKDMNEDSFRIPYEAAIFDTTLSANAFKGPMNYTEIDYSLFPGVEISDEWGWYRDPIDRINLTGNIIPISWLFFDYYGVNMMIVQPMGKEYEDYFEGDPDEFSAPYTLRKTNIESNQGDAYGLFYSTNSKFFFFNVLKEQ